jgi:hypothetical protein
MTNEQINIAIFEICGWKWEPEKNSFFHPENGRLKPKYAPDYCKDLNAIQDAVMTLPENKRILYGMYLASTCGHMTKKTVGLWHISTATARHHAEAFLKTLGKWEETSSD